VKELGELGAGSETVLLVEAITTEVECGADAAQRGRKLQAEGVHVGVIGGLTLDESLGVASRDHCNSGLIAHKLIEL